MTGNDFINNREKEIAYRESLLNKVCQGGKITVEERLWLQTHSVYNRRYCGDIFNRVVENKIPKSKWLCMKISI